LAPGQVNVLAVDRRAEQLRVALAELALEPGEAGDLGRTHEREVLGPEEHHLPLAGVAAVRDVLELLTWLRRDDGLEVERGETVSDGQHDDHRAPGALISPMRHSDAC